MKRRALFLDRDGTLVHAVHFPRYPEQLRIYDGIHPELLALQTMGFRLIVITNQSGIAKGYLTEEDLQRMHIYLSQQLMKEHIYLDAIYYCPHHPDGIIPDLAITCNCRKPQPGLLLRAQAELDIDLAQSWLIGDILDDVEAGNRAGCHTVLVDLGTEARPTTSLRYPTFVARDTVHALCIVRAACATELVYRPQSWCIDAMSEVNVCSYPQ